MLRFKFVEQTVVAPRTVNYARPLYNYAGQQYKAGESKYSLNTYLLML